MGPDGAPRCSIVIPFFGTHESHLALLDETLASNNYLSAEGLDLKKGEQDFRDRQQANKSAAGTKPSTQPEQAQ